MRLQVEQLEKERKELNEKMRVASKRLDHTERAYRKQERPLLSQDYEVQQANDKAAHEAAQKARIENYRLSHQQGLEAKSRLSRMLPDFTARREAILAKREEEFARKQRLAQQKIDEEKAKLKAQFIKKKEEERHIREEELRIQREREEEEMRKEEELRREEEGTYIISPFHFPSSLLTSHRRTSGRRGESPRRGRREAPPRAGETRQDSRGAREGEARSCGEGSPSTTA